MFELLRDTGLASSLMIALGVIGIPAAILFDAWQARRNPKD